MTHHTPQKPTAPDIHQLEFFRQGMALLPEPSDKRPGVAFFVQGNDFELTQRFCTCTLSKNRTCRHLKRLTRTCKNTKQESGQKHFDDRFRSSIWYRLAAILGEGCSETHRTVTLQTRKNGDKNIINVVGSNGANLVHYLSDGADRTRSTKSIQAQMKLGLTGTPIENRLGELKALLDLTLPGYLGKDADFENRYVKPIENHGNEERRVQLSNLISPFTLRRKKESVLDDLPEKIEDLRTCTLSEDQVKLYRDAVSNKGNELLKNLKEEEKTIPYIHIFTLLNLLKQICNHPALVKGKIDDYQDLQSGKWDLFKELLEESLQSGQKVVIYSQFLGMIDIIGKYLTSNAIDFVSLTGKTTNREKVIQRFNENPACRVFVGSLKAGGVGIDLVAGSVVIHYDRWWNAAKEDQATDRVHRIGQKRGVQVFKLVTEGTLEEKIAAIISKKRNLMDRVIEESDPAVMKSFTRKELIDLLAIPQLDSSEVF